jgi:hypothetical protein
MTARAELEQVDISAEEVDERAFLFFRQGAGKCQKQDMADIVFVKPDDLRPGKNHDDCPGDCQIQCGPGQRKSKIPAYRPGTMGIGGPLAGNSGFMGRYFRGGAMIETESDKLVAEPSQGSHFFHNITTLGINYITVSKLPTVG